VCATDGIDDAAAVPGQSLVEEQGPAKEPIRVLHVNSGNLYGGVETILATLGRLRQTCPAMESQFALCHEGRLSAELREAGARVHILGKVRISRPWSVRTARRALRDTLKREDFDMVMCHMPWSLAVFGGVARTEGRRLGFWAHGFHSGRGWLEKLAKRTTPDVAIANSKFTEKGVANLFPRVPRHIVYAPMALTVPPERERWRSAVREREGIQKDEVVIVQVSRMEGWKGHTLHLQALAQLQSIPSWTCWIIGGPQKPDEAEYFRRLQETAEQLGIAKRVKFFGQRSDVPELLAGADIFCQPNLEPEPFGLVFIEALWAGRPVVATALGGAAEIVDESCGLLTEPGSSASLAGCLRRMIESPDLRERLGAAAANRAWRISGPAAQLEKLREALAAGQRKAR